VTEDETGLKLVRLALSAEEVAVPFRGEADRGDDDVVEPGHDAGDQVGEAVEAGEV
jgi:hypothetical protein